MHVSLEHYLNTTDGAAGVMAHARLLLKLSRRYEAVAPAGLGHVSRVANYKSGKVVIHADNSAIAAKLRQMSQRLCQLLSYEGLQCSLVEIKVQPRQIPYQSSASQKKPLSAKASASLKSTTMALPAASPLRTALEELLARAEIDPA